MNQSTNPTVASIELAVSNDSKVSEKAKPSADKHIVGEHDALEKSTCDLEKKLQNSEAQLCNLEQEMSKSQTKNRNLGEKFDQMDVGQLIKFMEEKSESLGNCEVFRLQDSLEAKNNEIARLQDSIETKDIKITHLKLSLETQYNELQTEQKMFSNIAEQLRKKNVEAECLSDQNAKVKKEFCDIQKNLTAEIKRKGELTKEKAKIKRDLSDTQKRLLASEKQNVDTIKEKAKVKRELSDSLEAANKRIDDMKKEKEEMAEELKRWEHLRQLIGGANEYADGIRKTKAKSKNKQCSKPQCTPRLVKIVPPAAWISHGTGNWGTEQDELSGETHAIDDWGSSAPATDDWGTSTPCIDDWGTSTPFIDDWGVPGATQQNLVYGDEPEAEKISSLSLQEWKAQQKPYQPQFKVRKAGEGDDQQIYQKLVPIKKEKVDKDAHATEDENEHQMKREPRERPLNIEICFDDQSRNKRLPRRGRGPSHQRKGFNLEWDSFPALGAR